MPEYRQFLWWTGRLVLGMLAAFLISFGGLYAFLQSQIGLNYAAAWIGNALSDETLTVELEGLEGAMTSSLRVRQITISDRAGVFATAFDGRLDWRPSALLDRFLEIRTLSIGKVVVSRLPDPMVPATQNPSGIFLSDFNIRAEKISVAEADLAQPVLGQPQRLTAEAVVFLRSDFSKVNLDLALRRLDGGKDRAEIKVAYGADPPRLAAVVKVEEPTGGVLARLAGLPRGARLFIDLSGKGPTTDWKGALTLSAGADVAMKSDVVLALRGAKVGVSMAGSAKVDALLPAGLRPLASPSTRFRTDAELSPGEALSITSLAAQTNALSLTGTGQYRFATGQISASIAGKMVDRRSLASLLPDVSIGKADFAVTLDGAIDSPRVGLKFEAGEISRGPLQIAAMVGSAALTPIAPTLFGLEATARGEGLEISGTFPAGIIGPTLNATVSGKLQRDGALPELKISVESGPSKVSITGIFDQAGSGAGSYALNLAQIESLAASAGLPLKGYMNADGQFRVDLPEGVVQLSAQGTFADLVTSSPDLGRALGSRVPFSGSVDWRQGKTLSVTGLTISPAVGRLDGQAVMQVTTGNLVSELNLTVSELAKLSKPAATGVAGKATVSAKIEGPPGGLAAKGEILLSQLRIGENGVGHLKIEYDGRLEGTTAKSRLRLNGVAQGKVLDGRLNGVFTKDAAQLSDIHVVIGKNSLTGKLDFDWNRSRLAGSVKAVLDDLSDLPGAPAVGLAGAGEVVATSDASRDGTVHLTASTRSLRIANLSQDALTIRKTTARLRLRDPFTSPTGEGVLELEDFRIAGLQDGKAQLNVTGKASQIDWSIVASADEGHPVSLKARGSLRLSAPESRVSVKELSAKFANKPIVLNESFEMSWKAADWRLGPVDLSLDEGHLRLAGSLVGGNLDVVGKFDELPIRLASLIDPDYQIDGRAAGSLRVFGIHKAPTLAVAISARDIRPVGSAKADFAGFDLTLNVNQDGDRTRTTAKLVGPDQTSASLSMETAPLFGMAPFTLMLGPDLKVSGEMTAQGRLGLVDKLIGLGEDRVAGLINAKAKISGTLGHPIIDGNARLKDGSYEGVATGTVFRNISAEAVFSGDNVKLVSLSAGDGAGGRLSGTGTIQLVQEDASEGGFEFKLEGFTALRHPLVEAVISGGAILSGLWDSPQLVGSLTVEKGEIRIPDRLPDQIVELDVVEVNRSAVGGRGPAEAKEPSLAKTIPVSLDMTLTLPNRTFVRGRGLDSEWKGQLKVSGRSDAPVIEGELNAVRGTFAFAGKTFTVKSGTVSFPKTGTEPEIDATAEASLKDLTARIQITGRLSKPTIKISSEPVLPQEDVLAQILFGRSAGQLSALQAAQLAQTAATLSGSGGIGIVDKIRQTLGVDVLNVESGEDNGRGAALKAGKYLTEDVFLSVTQGAQAGSQKVGVEVKVLPNVTVESDFSGTSEGNIGLNWKWDY